MRWVFLCFIAMLVACTSQTTFTLQAIPPLSWQGGLLSYEQALQQSKAVEPLQLSEEMERFLDRRIMPLSTKRERLKGLTRAVAPGGELYLIYDGEHLGTALDAYRDGRANCLSYAHLMVAMGRYVGLDIHYQQVEVKPRWQQWGDLIQVSRHVNVGGRLNRRYDFTSDINKQDYYRADKVYAISDDNALAQHYNNLAMAALARENHLRAFGYLARALEKNLRDENLWSNLGYLYRLNDQWQDAETAYLTALQLNPNNRSALQNLAALYSLMGQVEKSQRYQETLSRYNKNNPYYHAQQAFEAATHGQWPKALANIELAIELKPKEFEFHLARLQYLQHSGVALSESDKRHALSLAKREHEKQQVLKLFEPHS